MSPLLPPLLLLLTLDGAHRPTPAGDQLRQPSDPCPATRSALANQGDLGRILQGEIVVHFVPLPGSRAGGGLDLGTAVALAAAPARRVFEVVADPNTFTRFMPFVTAARARPHAEGELVYQEIDLPFPLSNRRYEVLVRRHEVDTPEGRCLESRWVYVPGTGNIADTFGRWEALERTDGNALFAYVSWADPGGSVPDWAQNWVSRRALPRIVDAVRREAIRRHAR